MKKEPLYGPGNNPLDDRLIGQPMVVSWIVNAKRGVIWRIPPTINMLRRLASATRVAANRRVHYKHLDVGVVDVPAIEIASRKIYDADAVGLADGPQSALPHSDPITTADEPELRVLGPQQPVLLGDRQRGHRP